MRDVDPREAQAAFLAGQNRIAEALAKSYRSDVRYALVPIRREAVTR